MDEADRLLAASAGFLRRATWRAEGTGVLARGAYDPARFDPGLFPALGIACPDSLSDAIHKRLAEFLAGRAMARLALTALGGGGTVRIGADRAPVWPAGFAGSISHARGFCAALVLPVGKGSPGLDIEAIATGQTLESILRLTVAEEERAIIAATAAPEIAATLTFSAKETLFKALFPIVKRHFGFASAKLVVAPGADGLTLELTETLHPSLIRGRRFDIRHAVQDDHVLTWLLPEAGPPESSPAR